jgi:3-oxoacyl-[acyl-carrier-protein] synthase II
VLTGLGAVTAAGRNVPGTWDALLSGRSGVTDAGTSPAGVAGWVTNGDVDLPLPDRRLRHYLSRAARFGVTASLEALGDAGSDDTYRPTERGVAIATRGAQPDLEALADVLWQRHISDGRELPSPSPLDVIVGYRNTGIAVIERLAGCEGGALSFQTPGSGSMRAVGEAFRMIQDGEACFVLAGGYDAVSSLDLLGYRLLAINDSSGDAALLSPTAPPDAPSLVPGEGAAIMALEDREGALARGARIYAEIVGHGSVAGTHLSADVCVLTDTVMEAIAPALGDANLEPADMDCVVADRIVDRAIEGEYFVGGLARGPAEPRVEMMSTAPITGHMLCAAGALNVLVAALVVADQRMPPASSGEAGRVVRDAAPARTSFRVVIAVAGGLDGGAEAIVLRRHQA